MASSPLSAYLVVPSARRPKSRTKAQARARLIALDERLAEQLSKADLDAIVDATAGLVAAAEAPDEAADRPLSPVTGRAKPTAREILAAQRENLLRGFAVRRAVLARCLSVREVAEMLGTTRQTPHDRAAAGRLLAMKDRGRLFFPAWQFDPNGPDGILDGLAETLAALPIRSALARVLWFTTPKPQLHGRTPVQALQAGEVDAVIAEAGAAHAR